MDFASTVNKIDTAFLVDSGTESYTGSPTAEDEELTTVCDIDKLNCLPACKIQLHLLDKAVSLDEDVLDVPLQPIRTDQPVYTKSPIDPPEKDEKSDYEFDVHVLSGPDKIYPNEISLPSILRRDSCYESIKQNQDDSLIILRKVSFPSNDLDLASYKEPECDLPWIIGNHFTPEKILQIYQESCKQHQTIELDVIKQVILDIKNNTNYSAILNLTSVNLTRDVNETLEDLLKIVNFRTLILTECKFTSETINEFLNMLEYYQSVREIEICMDFDDIDCWKYFCNVCSNMILESLSFKSMVINDTYMRMLLNVLRNNPRITVLKFEACTLVKLPSFYLVENLMNNTSLRELYLPSTGLYTKEAECIGRFLQKNFYLKVLDISNNIIGDRGLEVLAKGLVKQNVVGYGLSVLLVFNNQLTDKSGPVINNIIMECKNLHTLNIGYNNLTDDVIQDLSSSLKITTSLEGLGLQCTLLTCKGIDYLAEAIENNTSLQKINLKGNKAIQVNGLERLCQALTSSKISKIEIDETNRSANDPEAYVQMVKRMNAICVVNRTLKDSNDEDITNVSQLISRKVSLSCEPRFIIPDAISLHQNDSVACQGSSPSKNRFQITKVQDNIPRPISRFKVTKVITTNEDAIKTDKFANIRSSISSNDSVDSLQLDVNIDSDD